MSLHRVLSPSSIYSMILSSLQSVMLVVGMLSIDKSGLLCVLVSARHSDIAYRC
jgi:energy-converting hydrogenase Eha subunit C